MLPALADTQPLCLRVLVLLRHRSRAVRFSSSEEPRPSRSEDPHIRVNRHVHMQGRLFQLFGIDIIHNHIRLARPGSKTVTDLTETQTASERQHQIAVLDREVARRSPTLPPFSDVQRVFVIDTVDAVRAVTTGIPSFSTTRMKTSCAAPIRIPFPALITGRLEVRTSR